MSKSFGYFCSFPSPENGSQESPNVKLRGIISPSTIFVTTQILRAFPPLYARSECIIICYKWPAPRCKCLRLKHYTWQWTVTGMLTLLIGPMGTPRHSWCPCDARKKRKGQWAFHGFQDRVDPPTQERHTAAALWVQIKSCSVNCWTAFGLLTLAVWPDAILFLTNMSRVSLWTCCVTEM